MNQILIQLLVTRDREFMAQSASGSFVPLFCQVSTASNNGQLGQIYLMQYSFVTTQGFGDHDDIISELQYEETNFRQVIYKQSKIYFHTTNLNTKSLIMIKI